MQEVNNREWRKLLEITKLQCNAIPFRPERERAEKLCDELLADCADAPRSTSSSDRIYRKELREELEKFIELSNAEQFNRYGADGCNALVRRYLEATANY